MPQMLSGFVYPEGRWLVSEPEIDMRNPAMRYEDFFASVGRWSLDVGLTIEATRGAFFSIDFSGYPEAQVTITDGPGYFEGLLAAMRRRVQIANAFALCLHSATLEVENLSLGGFRVTHEDLIHSESSYATSASGAGLGNLPFHPQVGFIVPIQRHGVCTEETIGLACRKLDSILATPDAKALELVVLLNHALVACRGHDFELSMVAAWTIYETLLDSQWVDYTERQADEHSLDVNRERRKFWSGRDFSASVISDILALGGAIASDQHRAASSVRKNRNGWIHGMKAVDYQAAVDAIKLAQAMISDTLQLNLIVSPSVGATGL